METGESWNFQGFHQRLPHFPNQTKGVFAILGGYQNSFSEKIFKDSGIGERSGFVSSPFFPNEDKKVIALEGGQGASFHAKYPNFSLIFLYFLFSENHTGEKINGPGSEIFETSSIPHSIYRFVAYQ